MSEPVLIKGLQADFVPSFYPGDNPSGLIVYGKNILIAVDLCSRTSAGGVMLLDELVDRMTQGATTGCIFDIGPEAFRLFDDGSRWQGRIPAVGDRVHFEKYAGILCAGRDGRTYRVLDYRAVAAGIDLTEAEKAEARQALAEYAAQPARAQGA